jgi:hypothetical protein
MSKKSLELVKKEMLIGEFDIKIHESFPELE